MSSLVLGACRRIIPHKASRVFGKVVKISIPLS
jgi:hypothetical protein